jgi:GxxExxY protein
MHEKFDPLSEEEERIGADVVDAAYHIHHELGPGLYERVYEVCMCHELRKRGWIAERQLPVPIEYDGIRFEEGFRLDVYVSSLVILELKAADVPLPVWKSQLLSHLRLMNRRLGYIINFHVPVIRDGITRIVL